MGQHFYGASLYIAIPVPDNKTTMNEGGRPLAKTDRQTGSITSRRGRIKAESINTGLTIEGSVGDDTVRAATEALTRLRTGNVEAARGIDSAGQINAGISYDLASAKNSEIARHLFAVRQLLDSAKGEGAPVELSIAASLADQLISWTEQGTNDSHPWVERLRELVRVLASAGMTVETASACAVAISTALKLALDIIKMIS